MLSMLFDVRFVIPQCVDFARAGGGGSSSGSIGPIGAAFAFGYACSYGMFRLVKKYDTKETAKIAAIVTAAVLTVLFTLLVLFLFSDALIMWWYAFECVAGLWVGCFVDMSSAWSSVRKNFQKADAQLVKAGWNKAELQNIAAGAFLRYQAEWSARDSSHFYEYLTESYARHATLMVRALAEMKRRNIILDPTIIRIEVADIVDKTDDNQDFFTAVIEAVANDRLYDEQTGQYLFIDNESFIEEWTFRRDNNVWLLARIAQVTRNEQSRVTGMSEFARKNHLYYSLDMGWLFLPRRGELFKNGRFGTSDINNHVIGTYHDVLTQLYTYNSSPENESNYTSYLVGQVNVPTFYGGILIERKTGLFHRMFPPAGYQKYELEWPDFNKNYAVYATDQSHLATFELLNPGFMAYLYDNFNDLNIEVVDNFIYFYTKKNAGRSDYSKLLSVLLKAFKELQL